MTREKERELLEELDKTAMKVTHALMSICDVMKIIRNDLEQDPVYLKMNIDPNEGEGANADYSYLHTKRRNR